MTRRELFVAPTAVAWAAAEAAVVVPVRLVMDGKAKVRPEVLRNFWDSIWPQAARNFEACGVRLDSQVVNGEIWRPPGREPVISGLERKVLNVVLTDLIPSQWDNGMALNGVTVLYRGFHVSMVAVNEAHGHQIPFLSVNTCVHELLHVFLLDIFERRPRGAAGQQREFRIDWYATRLWLFNDGAAIRESARVYVERLKKDT